MKLTFGFASLFIAIAAIMSCNSPSSNQPRVETEMKKPGLREMDISYAGDSITMNGFVAYDTSIDTKRPAILVIPEWWGVE
jgi:hypothetical protein